MFNSLHFRSFFLEWIDRVHSLWLIS